MRSALADRRFVTVRRVAIVLAVVVTAMRAQAQAPTVSLTVTDMGLRNAPIPGVNVRVLDDAGRLRDMGPTDGQGTFVTKKVARGEMITFEYELAGYVRKPERTSWKVVGPADKVGGTLISRMNQNAGYLRIVADIIDAIAAAAPTATAKKLEYRDQWERVTELPLSSQQVVGRELDGKQYLVDVGSFQNAVKDVTLPNANAR